MRTEQPVVVEQAATPVLAQGHRPATDLAESLDPANHELHLIGDSLAPRTVEEAVLDGLVVRAAL